MSQNAEEQRISEVPGTAFIVDTFKRSSNARTNTMKTYTRYFVTHAHSDHCRGLSEQFKLAPVHCTPLTAEVLHIKTGVSKEVLEPLPLDKPVFLDGVEVVLVDANHCPGAAQLLFRLPDGSSYIHTGDMRYHPDLKANEQLQRFRNCTLLFLDTTYCNQRYSFPPQEDSISYVASEVEHAFKQCTSHPLVVVCTYGIGKERILLECSRRTGHRVYVPERKYRVLQKLDLDMQSFFTTDQYESPIHVARWGFLGETFPFFQPNFNDIEEYRKALKYDHAIGFVPTGWMYEFKKGPFTTRSKHNTVLHLVPYSEHSSYQELREYVQWIKPHQVVPTVGVNPRADKSDINEKQRARRRMMENFRDLVNEKESKRKFLEHIGGAGAINGPIEIDDIKEQRDGAEERVCNPLREQKPAELINDVSESGDACEQMHQFKIDFSSRQDKASELRQLVGEQALSQEQAEDFLGSYDDDVNKAANAFLDRHINNVVETKRKADKSAALTDSTSSQQKPSKSQRRSSISSRPKANDKKQPSLQSFLSKAGQTANAHAEHGDGLRSQERAADDSWLSQQGNHDCIGGREMPQSQVEATGNGKLERESNKFQFAFTRKLTNIAPQSDGDCNVELDSLPYVAKSVADFDPNTDRFWKHGELAPYMHLARSFEEAIGTTKRLKLADIFCNCFRALLARGSAEEIIRAIYITLGRIADEHEGGELTVGGATVSGCICEATSSSKDRIEELYNQKGDLGDVAQQLRSKQRLLMKPAPLTISYVFEVLRKISTEYGSGSNIRKRGHVMKLLRAAQGPEMRFIVRTLVQNMRLGANRISVLQAFGASQGYAAYLHHRFGPRKISAEEERAVSKEEYAWAGNSVKRCFSLYPDLTCLLKCLIDGGVQKMLEECTLKPGLPVQPMLGQISRGITHAVKQFNGTFLAEFKYDGMRAQIHVLPNETRVFSRKNEDKTGQMPDVARITRECLVPSVSTAVLDAECVAIERSTGKFKSFQELSTRSRSDIEESQVNVDVAIFVFDMMYINGRTLVDLPLAERRAYAQESLHEAANVIQLAESTTIAEGTSQEECEECVTSMLHSSLSQQGEGLMLKKLHQPGALYEPGRRSESWMKVKKDYCSELREPLDLVVIGAWWGNGRKAGWLSPFLLACYDPEQEEYQSVCRCMSGFTDTFYKEWTTHLLDNCILNNKPVHYNTNERPSFWFEPNFVWEIRGADLSLSPMHCAAFGRMHHSRGLALRFPRFIRYRKDKSAEDATPSFEIARLFTAQERRVGAASSAQAISHGEEQLYQADTVEQESDLSEGGEG